MPNADLSRPPLDRAVRQAIRRSYARTAFLTFFVAMTLTAIITTTRLASGAVAMTAATASGVVAQGGALLVLVFLLRGHHLQRRALRRRALPVSTLLAQLEDDLALQRRESRTVLSAGLVAMPAVIAIGAWDVWRKGLMDTSQVLGLAALVAVSMVAIAAVHGRRLLMMPRKRDALAALTRDLTHG